LDQASPLPRIHHTTNELNWRVEADRGSYGKGIVYSSNWIIESIASQKLLSPSSYTKFIVQKTPKPQSFSRTKFSIREIIKIFDVVMKNP
jgi:hypothetical protein